MKFCLPHPQIYIFLPFFVHKFMISPVRKNRWFFTLSLPKFMIFLALFLSFYAQTFITFYPICTNLWIFGPLRVKIPDFFGTKCTNLSFFALSGYNFMIFLPLFFSENAPKKLLPNIRGSFYLEKSHFFPHFWAFSYGAVPGVVPRAHGTNFGEKSLILCEKKSPKNPQIGNFFPNEEFFAKRGFFLPKEEFFPSK